MVKGQGGGGEISEKFLRMVVVMTTKGSLWPARALARALATQGHFSTGTFQLTGQTSMENSDSDPVVEDLLQMDVDSQSAYPFNDDEAANDNRVDENSHTPAGYSSESSDEDEPEPPPKPKGKGKDKLPKKVLYRPRLKLKPNRNREDKPPVLIDLTKPVVIDLTKDE